MSVRARKVGIYIVTTEREIDVMEIVATGRILGLDKKELIFRGFWGKSAVKY